MTDATAIARRIVLAATLIAALAGASAAVAQMSVRVALPAVGVDAALEALAQECYEADLLSELRSESILDCSVVLEERKSTRPPRDDEEAEGSDEVVEVEDITVVRQRLRFTALERQDGISITADAWTEVAEPDTVIDEPIASEEYAARVRDVLVAVGQRLRTTGDAPPPWAGRYENEQAWRLEAHLRAVRYCDANLTSMNAATLGEQFASIGVWPLSDDVRDRCEQLHQVLLEWGLARGNTEPTLREYARYRAALPPEQRLCTGRLALAASCG